VITAVPLTLFAYAARRIRLSTLGLLQYLAPSVQLILGIWLYQEPFDRSRVLSFTFIWAALALYSFDNLIQQRTENPPAKQR
jgi:chloramphenicol-sensitive protein RarD